MTNSINTKKELENAIIESGAMETTDFETFFDLAETVIEGLQAHNEYLEDLDEDDTEDFDAQVATYNEDVNGFLTITK